jgi:putative DNA methylase
MVETSMESGIPIAVRDRPRVLIEEWLPIEALGVESRRERGASSSLPPLYFLHVWWARRPLAVSRAAVLASLLPFDFPKAEFMKLIGILGDPVAGRKMVDEVIAGIRKERVKDPYGYPRAFTHNPPEPQMLKLRSTLRALWGEEKPTVLDSFAGGGSIPFEAYRLGLNVILSELNPVACIIEKGTIEYPSKYGKELAKEIDRRGNELAQQVEKVLRDCFPRKPGETDLCYIWVRTVSCPECHLTVPLAPNWWLDRANKIGYAPLLPVNRESKECTFRISKHGANGFEPDAGSVSVGKGKCLRCSAVLDGDYLKGEAKTGRMGHQLASIGYKMGGGGKRQFREVTKEDLEGVKRAEQLLKKKLPDWEARGLVPNEMIPEGSKTSEPRRSGIYRWRDFFSPRQLLVHLTTLEAILNQPWYEIEDEKRREALRVYMALALDIAVDYNSLGSILDVTRVAVKHLFKRHDFAFAWSYAEIDGASKLFEFCVFQQWDAYRKIVALLKDARGSARYLCADAASLPTIGSDTIPCVVIDPPYSTNVMYAELADFFYVWMKRALYGIFPELFKMPLTDKENEAVANVSRFRGFEARASDLAEKDYEEKMFAAFKELHRVLRSDGVLTVMFTHKRSEAWDALAKGLIDAGFEITASWPVRTESEHSLHQARKAAAASTILLVCRKRPMMAGTRGWWEDLQPLVRDTAYTKAQEYIKRGIQGVDLLLATYGPALQVLSSRWPVVDNKGNEVRPDAALREASKAVSDLRFRSLTEQKVANVDMPTRFYIHAWDFYQAQEFPSDAAIRLGHALGVDIDDLSSKYGVIKKKGDFVELQGPENRRRAKRFKVDGEGSYNLALDKLQATILTYEDKGARGVKQLYQSTGFLLDKEYVAAIDALLNCLPTSTSEYETLTNVAEYAMDGKVKDRRDPSKQTRRKRLDDFEGDG